jgi:hypothetical protein
MKLDDDFDDSDGRSVSDDDGELCVTVELKKNSD